MTPNPNGYTLTSAELNLLQYLHTHSAADTVNLNRLHVLSYEVCREARLTLIGGLAYFGGQTFNLREPADLRRLADALPYDTLHGGG